MISEKLIRAILAQYALSPKGIHGLLHWGRVLENGLRLAETTNAKIEVIELFAVFHDSKRTNDAIDKNHGRRGGDYAASLWGKLFDLSEEDFNLLYTACAYHTDGLTEGDITVQTCWDADRLDLGRVRIKPKSRYLCTASAKSPQMIKWANERSRKRFVPEILTFGTLLQDYQK